MSNELRNRIAEVISETPSPLHDHGQAQAQAIIDLLGMRETDTSRHNEMVKYETKWLPRSDVGEE